MRLAVLYVAYLASYTRHNMYAEATAEAIYVAETGCERGQGEHSGRFGLGVPLAAWYKPLTYLRVVIQIPAPWESFHTADTTSRMLLISRFCVGTVDVVASYHCEALANQRQNFYCKAACRLSDWQSPGLQIMLRLMTT